MHRSLLLFILFISWSALAPAQEKKRFSLYASLLASVPVQLADGSKWQMDKGDTFPVVMYKEQHTKLILQLGGTSFLIRAEDVKVIDEKDLTEAQMNTYRNNVSHYLESRSEKWKAEQTK